MKRLVLDTNIAIDALVLRKPFGSLAQLVLGLGELGEFELWMSTSQATDVYYILANHENGDRIKAKQQLAALRQFVHMRALLEDDIDAALASNWDDFEDACVYQAALHVKPDAIVTNNVKDFDRSSIPVFDCQGLFDWIEEKEGISYAELAFGGGEGE